MIVESKKYRWVRFLSACLPLLLITAYHLLFYNRYLPVSEGWFSAYLKLMSKGMKPYQDFYFFLPPLYLYLLQGFQFFFGFSIYAMKILGLFITALITLFCYNLYRFIFSIIISIIVTLFSMFYYISNITYIGYDFFQFMTLFSLIGTYSLCLYVKNCKNSDFSTLCFSNTLLLLLAGSFYACSMLIKQSNGLVIFSISFLALALVVWNKDKSIMAFKPLCIFLLGFIIPIGLIAIYLYQQNILITFLNSLLHGTQAKGSLTAIAFAWIPRLFSVQVVTLLAIYVCSMCCLRFSFQLSLITNSTKSSTKILISIWILFFITSLAIYLPYYNISLSYFIRAFIPLIALFSSINFTSFIGVISILLASGYLYFYKKKSDYSILFIISMIAVGFAVATGTSAAIADGGIFLSTGLVIGQILNMTSWKNIGHIGLCIILSLLVLYMTSIKYTLPYSWWFLTQPDIRQATTPCKIKNLEGIYFSNYNLSIIETVNNIIQQYSRPTDTIFTFPNIPLFYFLNNRIPSTFGIVHWFDVAPDSIALADAATLLKKQPKIIVLLQPPEPVWQAHEMLFRNNNPSKQRDIINAINELTYYPDTYILAAQFVLPESYLLKVFRKI